MANARQENLTRGNDFYRDHFNFVMTALIAAIAVLLLLVMLVLYQLHSRPLPLFFAAAENGQQMQLHSFNEPNLLSTTITQWASKAAVAAYTFDFVNYNKQAELVRPYFTEAGWRDYANSVSQLIQTIVARKIFVNGVVSGAPVISNQGDIDGEYLWRVQIPFLVTYQSAEETTRRNYTVIITIVKVPTTDNPAGIGIDQFVME